MSVHEIFPFSPPFLEEGAGVIVCDRGRALPAQWDATIGGFRYAVNQLELAEEALAIVAADFPDATALDSALCVFTCPQQLLERCDFNTLNLPVES